MISDREFDQCIADDWTERRIKTLERALREIDAEIDEYIDITKDGGPNLAARVRTIIQEAGVSQ